MKRIVLWTLVLSLLASCLPAMAASGVSPTPTIIPAPTPFALASGAYISNSSGRYSDAPANPTQENMIEITATSIETDGTPMPFTLMKMLPTELTVSSLAPIFDFVDISVMPPAYFFPEHVQEDILKMGLKPEALFMPEYASLLPQVYTDALEKGANVQVEMEFDIAYPVDIPVVVVMGWPTEHGIEWRALPAYVPKDQHVHYTIPADLLEIINGQETLFSLLTVKPGLSKAEYSTEEIVVSYEIPSITSGDVTTVVETYSKSADGEPIPVEVVLVEQNHRIAVELDALENHINVDEITREPIMSYFDREINRQVQLLLPPEVDTHDLVAYEIACLESEKYIDPYGDVMACFSFATPYEEGQPMVSLLALPDEEDHEIFVWTPLHTEVVRNYPDPNNPDVYTDIVEITFSSEVLLHMLEKTALLIVLSTPMPE